MIDIIASSGFVVVSVGTANGRALVREGPRRKYSELLSEPRIRDDLRHLEYVDQSNLR